MSKGPSARCLECEEKIQFEEQPRLGMLVICDSCGAELEVVRKSPLELDWPYVDDDDSEDDDFDYDDDYDENEDWDDEDEDWVDD